MTTGLGWFLIAFGILQLLLHEVAVRIKRRFKPWWRDDDTARDRQLYWFLSFSTFATSVAAIEVGQWLADTQLLPLAWRIAIYVAFAILIVARLRQPVATT